MKNHIVYTINREYGSGGRSIGEELSKKLDIPFYDKTLLQIAAKEAGVSEKLFENIDEKPTNSFLYSLVIGAYSVGNPASAAQDMCMSDKLFLAESEVIRKAAANGSCVIVGRCGDYVLRDSPNIVSVFIHGEMPDKIERATKEYGLPHEKIEDVLSKTDKKRASYYNYYTGKKWNSAVSYDLCINSSATGIEGAVDMIAAFGDLHDLIQRKTRTPK